MSQTVFVPISPCRVVDTRGPGGALGAPALAARSPRTFPILASPCLPPTAAPVAYALNVTIVPPGAVPGRLNLTNAVAFVTVWPSGELMPVASVVNSWLGSVAHNAVIVQAGAGGSVDVFSTDATDVIIDLAGYFEPAPTSDLTAGLGIELVTQPTPSGSTTEVKIDDTVVQLKP